jgi:glycosyltransferase involved in cell wall biosynthesis
MISIIIPAKNEAVSLKDLLPSLKSHYPEAEIIVVNDGSTDNTAEVSRALGAKVITHSTSRGNGAAIKSGARQASGEILVFMDADGQHQAKEIQHLLKEIEDGYDLVVGSRQGREGQANAGRWAANTVYNQLASWISEQPISDLTSGFRAARADYFRQFLPLLPNGFSYPTTSTMAFLRAGYGVKFVPVEVLKRTENTQSHIKLFKDGRRFLIIIFKIGTLFSPMKIFGLFSAFFFACACGYYAHTFITAGRFTNMGVLLFSVSVLIFLIGLLSEQITQLLYSTAAQNRHSEIKSSKQSLQ